MSDSPRPSTPVPLPGAVCVTYNPDPARLDALLDRIRPQVAALVVVDNASAGALPARIEAMAKAVDAEVLLRPANGGIAAGLNAGLAWAEARGLEHLLLLDQDSLPAPDMVRLLVGALDAGTATGLVAVGPCLADEASGACWPFLRIGRFRLGRASCGPDVVTVPADVLLTSGMLVDLAAARRVGRFDESLFIDHVDTDWCLRARAAGLRVAGICRARLVHALGDRPVRVWLGRPRVFYAHSPLREYFYARNTIALVGRAHVPFAWSATTLAKLVARIGLLALLPGRLHYLASVARGVRDALLGVSGPAPIAR